MHPLRLITFVCIGIATGIGILSGVALAMTKIEAKNCISSDIFDLRTNNLGGTVFFIKRGCPLSPPKPIPAILQEKSGVGSDGKIRIQHPKNSIEDVRKRFHRMKRPEKEKRGDTEKSFFRF